MIDVSRPVVVVFVAVAVFLAMATFEVSADTAARGETAPPLALRDVFELELVSDPQVAADGSRIVFLRNFMDIQHDRRRSTLWTTDPEGKEMRPLTSGMAQNRSPRLSPDGNRLAYVSATDDGSEIFLRWLDSGHSTRLTQLPRSPADLAFSPDGRFLAFSMFVPEKSEPLVKLPEKPEGAEWADPPRAISQMIYRGDGRGYLEEGYTQLLVVPADGGTPRQVTHGPYHHRGGFAWSGDGAALIFSANRRKDWRFEPNDSEVFEVDLASGEVRALTDRRGPDYRPVVSPDGRHIAYLGYDDHYQGYQITGLYVMSRDGQGHRLLTADLDRRVAQPVWAADGQGLYFSYSDHGNGKIGHVSLAGQLQEVASDVGGTSLGRPYSSGSFAVGGAGDQEIVAFTHTTPYHPADLAVRDRGGKVERITDLNQDLFGHRRLGEVEEIRYRSSHDGREIQGWIVKPPDFDPAKKYPLILEIHGGPFADYGDRFSAEVQLFAAAGFVVLYTNPRGSSGYGQEFGNLIHHAYPGDDYHDLMSGVDAVIARGYVDTANLFVTGGSGGGVLTAWIVGKTHRFRAAVAAKPVINWTSFVLTADSYNFFYRYWFPGPPWDFAEHYASRSPLSLVGQVQTPTLLLTGEEDYRTPISESEQLYQALQLRGVDSMLVRVPGASHGITQRPSHLMAKVAYILAWFEKYRVDHPSLESSPGATN